MAKPKLGKKMSITSRSLRLQLLIAFCLMSVIPMLALLNFIFPSLFPTTPLDVVIATIIILMILGFLLLKGIIDPILEITSEVKVIANGELSHKIDIQRDDEIGELSTALNQLTQRIKSHMDELKIYGERTKDINLQVNKQVIALSGLLQISNLIAKGSNIKDIFEIIVGRLIQIGSSSWVFFILEKEKKFVVEAQANLHSEAIDVIESPAYHYIFKNLFLERPHLKIDKTSTDASVEELLKLLKTRNILIYPVMVQKRVAGLLGVGNSLDGFEYSEDELELVNIFARQLGIAVENDLLIRKVQDLEVRDALTDLYNRRYIITRLDEEVLRAISHQRPCSFIAIKLKNLKEVALRSGNEMAEEILKRVAEVLKTYGGEIDRVGRIEDDEFGIVLPEKNKKRAQELSAQIKDKIQKAFEGEDSHKKPFINISVVENPIDGIDAASLLEKTRETLERGD